MGLFSKKEACPICGREVKGLFLVKISEKQTLCKDCSKQVSMQEDLLKTATPDFIREHLDYRRKNAELYTSAHWDAEFSFFGLHIGADAEKKLVYLSHDQMHNEDNPTVFSFDQITGYELFRLKKKVDDASEAGETAIESGLTALGGIARLVSSKSSNTTDYFRLCLTTTDPYWPAVDLKITFTPSQLYGIGGYHKDVEDGCQMIKRIVRKEPIRI